jgi:hypothetical protein
VKTGIILSILFGIFILSFSVPAFAHPHLGTLTINEHTHEAQSEIIPLDATIGLEKTSLFFHAPEDNILPWGFVEGKITNPVAEYPVIIQMFSKGEATHFAQTTVNEDGTYEYKFRVKSVYNGEIIRPFLGDYTVVIYKVVYLNSNLSTT